MTLPARDCNGNLLQIGDRVVNKWCKHPPFEIINIITSPHFPDTVYVLIVKTPNMEHHNVFADSFRLAEPEELL